MENWQLVNVSADVTLTKNGRVMNGAERQLWTCIRTDKSRLSTPTGHDGPPQFNYGASEFCRGNVVVARRPVRGGILQFRPNFRNCVLRLDLFMTGNFCSWKLKHWFRGDGEIGERIIVVRAKTSWRYNSGGSYNLGREGLWANKDLYFGRSFGHMSESRFRWTGRYRKALLRGFIIEGCQV